jgi:hypothetical protein
MNRKEKRSTGKVGIIVKKLNAKNPVMEKNKVIKRFALTPEMTCPELEGYKLPEIPKSMEEDANKAWQSLDDTTGDAPHLFKFGYTKAREKYEFTEADIIEAFKKGFLFGADGGRHYLSKLLSSLRTPRTPIAIEVEILFDYNSILMDGKAIPATHPDGTVKGVWVYE